MTDRQGRRRAGSTSRILAAGVAVAAGAALVGGMYAADQASSAQAVEPELTIRRVVVPPGPTAEGEVVVLAGANSQGGPSRVIEAPATPEPTPRLADTGTAQVEAVSESGGS